MDVFRSSLTYELYETSCKADLLTCTHQQKVIIRVSIIVGWVPEFHNCTDCIQSVKSEFTDATNVNGVSSKRSNAMAS